MKLFKTIKILKWKPLVNSYLYRAIHKNICSTEKKRKRKLLCKYRTEKDWKFNL